LSDCYLPHWRCHRHGGRQRSRCARIVGARSSGSRNQSRRRQPLMRPSPGARGGGHL